jgi:hypothetical protein
LNAWSDGSVEFRCAPSALNCDLKAGARRISDSDDRSENGSLVTVFNGELFDYAEAKRFLERRAAGA